MGRPKKDIDAATMRLERDAYELARQAAAIHGESIVVYASRVVRERAKADLLENAKKIVGDADSDSASRPKRPGKPG